VEEVVKAGLFAAAEFDGGTAGPYEIHAMDLASSKTARTKKPASKKAKKA